MRDLGLHVTPFGVSVSPAEVVPPSWPCEGGECLGGVREGDKSRLRTRCGVCWRSLCATAAGTEWPAHVAGAQGSPGYRAGYRETLRVALGDEVTGEPNYVVCHLSIGWIMCSTKTNC